MEREKAGQVARRVLSWRKTYRLNVVAGTPNLALPLDRFIEVHRAYLETARRDLDQLNLNDDTVRVSDYGIKLSSADWETQEGTPTAFVLDYRPGYLRLAPIPTAADTLVVQATVMPAPITAGAPLPFTFPEDVELMLLWMQKRAYSKHDADTFDEQKALKFQAEFESRALSRQSEHRRQTRKPGVVRSTW